MQKSTLIILLIFSSSIYSQDFLSIKVDDLPDSLINHESRINCFVQIHPNDTVLDIGAGNMKYSLFYANKYPLNIFYFEDIDSTKCNKEELKKSILEKGYKQVNIENIYVVIGDTNSTTLPTHKFDVIIIQSTIHILADNKNIISDIRRILKPNGRLIIIERITENKNRTHPDCSTPYLTYSELDAFIDNYDFTIKKDWKIIYDKSDGYEFNYISRYLELTKN